MKSRTRLNQKMTYGMKTTENKITLTTEKHFKYLAFLFITFVDSKTNETRLFVAFSNILVFLLNYYLVAYD